MKRLFNYFKESWRELGKINWPNRQQTMRLTVAVIIYSVALAAFIGAVDAGWSALVKRVLI